MKDGLEFGIDEPALSAPVIAETTEHRVSADAVTDVIRVEDPIEEATEDATEVTAIPLLPVETEANEELTLNVPAFELESPSLELVGETLTIAEDEGAEVFISADDLGEDLLINKSDVVAGSVTEVVLDAVADVDDANLLDPELEVQELDEPPIEYFEQK